jgi:hypothetical protein
MKTDYLNEILEDEQYSNLDVIDYCSDCVLGYDMTTNKAYYIYKVNEDMGFCFHLLCEVGEVYQTWFKAAISGSHTKVITTETETDYYETLIPYSL